jgi:uncharacterized hydrophobic protein (TIGR00271 family)
MKNEKPDKNNKKEQENSNQELINDIAEEKAKTVKKGFLSHFAEAVSKKGFLLFKKGIGGVIDEYKVYKDKKGELLEKYEAYETVVAGSTDTIEFYVLIILSCIIATVGLYLNSAAVIIGAMIVAPLMGPLFGFSAGMLWGSGRVIWEAVTTLIKGTVLCLLVTTGMSFCIPGIVVTQEMLGRMNPSIFDILIALCCGFIGAYAYVNKRVSAAIPGVAISVALMPPLCTIGIGIGLRNWNMAQGASLLFAVNLIGISLAALIVFYFVRLNPKCDDESEFKKAKHRAAGHIFISIIILLILATPLYFLMRNSIKVNLEKDSIYSAVYESVSRDKVYSIEIENRDKIYVNVVILEDENTKDLNIDIIEKRIMELLHKESALNMFLISSISGEPEDREEEVKEETALSPYN